ncbi:MAG: aldehyde dehydrogenase family protein [Nitrospinota bacterium]
MEIIVKPLINGIKLETRRDSNIISPYNQELIGKVHLADQDLIDQAILAASNAFREVKGIATYKIAKMLSSVAEKIYKQKELLAKTISYEVGKPISLAKIEVDRAAMTFSIAAAESIRIQGERIDLELDEASQGHSAIVKRFPVGIIAAITPFNFPLNLVAHKLAPALASKNVVILKPAPQGSITASILGDIITESGILDGQLNIVYTDNSLAESLVRDERIDLVSFTGSDKVGWMIKNIAGQKKTLLELGGNATAIVANDANLSTLIPRLVTGSFAYAGQICISIQHILFQEDIFDEALELFINATKNMTANNDPFHEDTLLGPLIDNTAIQRIDRQVHSVINNSQGELVIGGKYKKNVYEATILKNVDYKSDIAKEEVFGPVVIVNRYKDIHDAVKKVNSSKYGLQSALFTNRLNDIYYTFDNVETGGVIINDFPTFRSDIMPYGGIKGSGLGREGVKYAIEEMTYPKCMVINQLANS